MATAVLVWAANWCLGGTIDLVSNVLVAVLGDTLSQSTVLIATGIILCCFRRQLVAIDTFYVVFMTLVLSAVIFLVLVGVMVRYHRELRQPMMFAAGIGLGASVSIANLLSVSRIYTKIILLGISVALSGGAVLYHLKPTGQNGTPAVHSVVVAVGGGLIFAGVDSMPPDALHQAGLPIVYTPTLYTSAITTLALVAPSLFLVGATEAVIDTVFRRKE